jgi:MFS family permease
MTVPTLLFIDRWGRRPLLLWGALLMALWLFIVGGVMGAHGNPVPSIQGNSNLTWQVTGPPSKAVIACTYLFVATFAPTWGPTAWVYVSEIFPLKYRAKANGLCAATNCIPHSKTRLIPGAFNFALAFFVPPAFKNIQWRTYIVFGVFCVAMFIQVFFMFPETRQKSLEEIDILFDENIAPWKTRSGSRVDERAQAIARGDKIEKGKRNSDTTLQQDEHMEKPTEQNNEVV